MSSPPMYRHASLASNHSLQLDAPPPPAERKPGPPQVKPLSPIFEKTNHHIDGTFSDMREVEPQTPASFGDHASTYSAFLRRPLRRSISQASTSSLRTVGTASMAAPTLPPINVSPLDIRGALCPPAHRSGPQLFSTVYEDANSERTGSFVTARSVYGDEREAGTGTGTTQGGGEGSRTLVSSTELPPTLPDTPGGMAPTEPDSDITFTQATPRPRVHDPTSTGTSDSFIWRRWRKGLSFGSTRPRFSLIIPSYMFKRRSLPALLFWAGFVAPWCWLIGGWLVAEGRQDEKAGGPLLPIFKVHLDPAVKERPGLNEKGKKKAAGNGATTIASSPSRRARWWTQWRPSNNTVFVQDPDPVQDPETPYRLRRRDTEKDPPSQTLVQSWVVRCRVAAVSSGALLVVAFVVAIIVAGNSK
ncbi:hypothetical protein FA95DRAFT_1602022 [Auriscalpium vulgare]|uniref:Uncharacterized protein n=1 Tax=Auriscalpium vulgare TaxID=40419 RepID=A0ACB8S8C2_9AGAM|nr:hypothetical protein FA95DRAFT_1602022 [Auriscalpium vulgare]